MQPLQPDQATFLLANDLASRSRTSTVSPARSLKPFPRTRAIIAPTPLSMSALDLAWHIASAENFFMDRRRRG
jgi:hypothetical protein